MKTIEERAVVRQRKTKPLPKVPVPDEPDWHVILADLLKAGYRRKTISKIDGIDIHEHTLDALRLGKRAKVPWRAGQMLLALHATLGHD